MRLFLSTLAWVAVLASPGADAACQHGLASATFIGAHDLQLIAQAAAKLPKGGLQAGLLSVRYAVSPDVKTAPVPAAVVKVLPQYAGYRAFRASRQLVIVDATSRTVAYMMPLGLKPATNCPN